MLSMPLIKDPSGGTTAGLRDNKISINQSAQDSQLTLSRLDTES